MPIPDPVAALTDWCEHHLEGQRGREVGMTFALLVRTYERLAAMEPTENADKPSEAYSKTDSRGRTLLERLGAQFARSPVKWDKVRIDPAKIAGQHDL